MSVPKLVTWSDLLTLGVRPQPQHLLTNHLTNIYIIELALVFIFTLFTLLDYSLTVKTDIGLISYADKRLTAANMTKQWGDLIF